MNPITSTQQFLATTARWQPGSSHTKTWHPPLQPGWWQRAGCSWLAALVLLVIAVLPQPAIAAEPGEQTSGNLLLRMQDGYEVATRIHTDVKINVSGSVARVSVSQQFRNDGSNWVEGVYVFPLPAGAAVDRLRLRAGDRVIEGEIREKAAARAAYETAKREGKRASLVGQQRANMFTTSVANIAPGEMITVEIGYLDTVAYDDGTFSLRFPMTMTPRYIPGRPVEDRQGNGWSADTDQVPDASLITPPMVESSDHHGVTLHAEIDAGMALDLIASRYHPIDVESDAGRYTVSLKSANEVTDHDLELLWRPAKSAVPEPLLFAEDDDDQRHLLLMLMPPTTSIDPGDLPPRDLTIVIDTSGSMHGVSLQQAKEAVLLALNGLQPADHFNMVQFNSTTSQLFPHSVPATPANVRTALSWVRNLQANGGTEMRSALQAALQNHESGSFRQVVFVTDGAVGNELALYQYIEANLGETRLFTVGIGSAPNGFFMRKAAELGRGSFVYISALHEVQEKMTRLLRRLREPMLTDIELQWPDGLEPVTYPSRVADLYNGEPVVVKARIDSLPRAGDQLVIRGNAITGPWSVDVPLVRASSNPGVAALWARARIAELTDRQRRGASAEDMRALIVETALRYRLVSKHTSLVAVDKTPVRPADAGLDKEQVPNLLPYGQSQKAIFGFPATATAGPLLRLTGAAFLAAGMLLFLYRVCSMKIARRDAPDSSN